MMRKASEIHSWKILNSFAKNLGTFKAILSVNDKTQHVNRIILLPLKVN
jgi:hypothetical protein